MDTDVARHLVRVAFRASGELERVLPLLKATCGDEEYRELGYGVAAAMHAIGEALTDKAVASHPELEAEIGASMERYGRYL